VSNWYTTLGAVRDRVGLGSSERTDVNTAIAGIIENVSRQMDTFARRHFFVQEAARTFTYRPRRGYYCDPLVIPDLVAVSTFELDHQGDLTYTDVLDPSDYVLGPEDAPLESPPRPYWQVARWPRSPFLWSSWPRGLRITGSWGCYDVRETMLATVGDGGIDDDPLSTYLPVSDGTEFSVGLTLRIDDEQLFVMGVTLDDAGDALTVQRAVNGTSAGEHVVATPIQRYTYPIISESCLTQVQRRYERTIGRSGRVDDPSLRAFASLDRDVEDAVYQLRREIR